MNPLAGVGLICAWIYQDYHTLEEVLMQSRRWRTAVCSVALLVLFGTTVEAQTFRPAGVGLVRGEWTFVVILAETPETISAPSILALRNKAATVGDNLVAVWYTNPQVPNAEWPAMAWESQDHWEAIKYVKAHYDIADTFDKSWPTPEIKTSGAWSEEPAAYAKGLLESDPLFPVVWTESRDEIVAMLTAAGYKSADIPIELDSSDCEQQWVLDAIARTAVFAAANSPSFADAEAQFASMLPVVCAQAAAAQPVPTPVPVVPGTTTPQPGTPLNPGGPWQRDSRPPTYEPGCSTVTTCCYSAPIIWLYTTTNWLGFTVIRYCESEISFSCPNPSGGPCPATPTCPEPPGPHSPPPAPGPVPCGYSYY
jgi:hypothetical protein